ncbi:Phospholipase A1-IIalpha [Camellia lanceoleosa]|uniref:Phospholipase A1-IIalpha n=1 Tax=Camellia lanceoleosa TaxID=1840588 RepID=A0ACC0HGK7_9ERIC|nr:Phospholipase A1-IIalpha [Camellia lanceoleosa]
MIKNIARRWRVLSGQDNWKNLLDPLGIDLRCYIIHYAEMAQATYDIFNTEKTSEYAGSSRYSKKNLFARVGLAIGNSYHYTPTKYLYSTLRYVVVATDQGKVALGRKDILVAWRGTIHALEWIEDFDFPLLSAYKILGKAVIHKRIDAGSLFLLYTIHSHHSPKCKGPDEPSIYVSYNVLTLILKQIHKITLNKNKHIFF